MLVDIVYKLKRGNQTQAVGIVVKGSAASVQILGSNSEPELLSDMVDCTDDELLTEGAWSFSMLPEFIVFKGVADSLEIVGMGFDKTETTF